jgi:hypothetical protein
MQGNQDQPDEIQALLEADEHVIWQGEPARVQPLNYGKFFVEIASISVLFGIAFGGLGYFIIGPHTFKSIGTSLIAAIYMTLFIFVILWIVLGISLSRLERSRATADRFVLTNKRLIEFGPGDVKKIFFIDTVSTCAYKPLDAQEELGDIKIEAGRTQTSWLGVPDAENVFRLILHARNEAISQRENPGRHSP